MKILAIVFLLASCGMEPSNRSYEPGPTTTPPPGDGTWNGEVKALVQEQCALAGCHAGAGFLRTGAAFKASSSLRRIQSGNMPLRSSPNYGLYNAAKKRTFIDYLSGS